MRAVCRLLSCYAALGFAALAIPASADPPAVAQLTDLRSGSSESGGSWLYLKADGPLDRAVIFELDDPRRLVIDLPQVLLSGAPRTLELRTAQATGVRVGQHPDKLRLVIDADEAPDALAGRRILPTVDGLVIAFGDVNPLQLPVAPRIATAEAKKTPQLAPRLGQAIEVEPPSAAKSAAAAARVYGIELERSTGRERLLIFSNRAPTFDLVEIGPLTLELRIRNAVLDGSAPRRLEPKISGPFVGLSVRESMEAEGPVVIFEIRRRRNADPQLSSRGGLLALDFPRAEDADDRSIALQLEDVEINEVIAAIARETGQPFLHNEELTGRLTLMVADRVTPAEALQLLDAGLQMLGFATIPTPGGLLRVIEIESGSREASFHDPLPAPGSAHEQGQNLMTTLARLDAADATSVAVALQPWRGPASQAFVHAPTNSIILAGAEQRLRHLLALIRALDHAAQEDLVVRRLRHREADPVAELARKALSGLPTTPALEIWSDARTNSVLARSSPARLDELRAFLARIDRPLSAGGGSLSVVRILNQDPEELAKRLRELANGSTNAVDGQPAAPGGTLLGRDFSVAVDVPTHSLVLRADPETARVVREVIDALDRRSPMVSVDVHVVEVDMSDSLSLGIDFFVPLTRPSGPGDIVAAFLSNPTGGGLRSFEGADTRFFGRYTRAPLLVPIVDGNGLPISVIVPRESAVVMADGRDVHVRTLIRPSLVMVPGEEHELVSGNIIPIPVGAASEPGDLGGLLQTRLDIERQDVGMTLRMRPILGEAGRVKLDLDLETTDLAPSLAGPIAQVGPTLRQRRLHSTVSLGGGELAVLGTFAEERHEDTFSGIPFLKDIPLLGRLFAATRQARRKTQLLVAVSARVLENPADRLAESLRQRIAFERSSERLAALDAISDAPYAVHVATRKVAGDAEAIANHFDSGTHRTLVSQWGLRSSPHFDVYLTGYRTLRDASRAALLVEEAGFRPQVVVVPDGGPRLSQQEGEGRGQRSREDLDSGPDLDAIEDRDDIGIAHADATV